jgi:AcrR family transcriptional regulator
VSLTDRRSVRRRDTIDEIVAVATELMAAEGPGALSLAEVARRIGVRPPSLYQYFPSKLALYDELFARGMRDLNEFVLAAVKDATDPVEALRGSADAFVRWAVSHPVQAQIMFWRPVPGFVPSEAAYRPAVESLDMLRSNLRASVAQGRLAAEAASDRGVDLLTTMISGVISQQIANEPHAPSGGGRFASLTVDVVGMFLAHFAPGKGAPS